MQHLRDPESAFVHWKARSLTVDDVYRAICRAFTYWRDIWRKLPVHDEWNKCYELDLKMLLAVAVDSSWFNPAQHTELSAALRLVAAAFSSGDPGAEKKTETPLVKLQARQAELEAIQRQVRDSTRSPWK